MPPCAQSDLSDRARTQPVIRVEQKADLDTVARGERERFEQLPSCGVFAAQRLEDAGQFGPQCRQQWPHRQLRDASPAVLVRGVTDPQRPPIEALDQFEVLDHQQGTDEGGDEVRTRFEKIGIDEHDDLARGGRDATPQNLSLAVDDGCSR